MKLRIALFFINFFCAIANMFIIFSDKPQLISGIAVIANMTVCILMAIRIWESQRNETKSH